MQRYVLENKETSGAPRAYQAYRYRGPDLSELWNTSVPQSQQAAVDYIDFIAKSFWGQRASTPEYIEGRLANGEYEAIKWEVVGDDGERVPFVSTIERRFSEKAELNLGSDGT